jgi:hypothetical protein
MGIALQPMFGTILLVPKKPRPLKPDYSSGDYLLPLFHSVNNCPLSTIDSKDHLMGEPVWFTRPKVSRVIANQPLFKPLLKAKNSLN